jgi:hypothetical protein
MQATILFLSKDLSIIEQEALLEQSTLPIKTPKIDSDKRRDFRIIKTTRAAAL